MQTGQDFLRRRRRLRRDASGVFGRHLASLKTYISISPSLCIFLCFGVCCFVFPSLFVQVPPLQADTKVRFQDVRSQGPCPVIEPGHLPLCKKGMLALFGQ